MKKLVLSLIVSLFIFVTMLNAEPIVKSNSYLPLGLKETLKLELNDPAQEFTTDMDGDVWVRFNVDVNGVIEITEFSSNNITLGYFVMNVLTELSDISQDYPVGDGYAIKISICCPNINKF